MTKTSMLLILWTLVISSFVESIKDGQLSGKYFPDKIDFTCQCGTKIESRKEKDLIANGEKVSITGKYPWMALVKRNGQHHCSGALINSQYVITAAHCVENDDVGRYQIVMGIHNIRNIQENGDLDLSNNPQIAIRNITRIKKHSQFNFSTIGFPRDIALLKFTPPITFTNQIRPICLPSASSVDTFIGSGTIVGWGTDMGRKSTALREANVRVFDSLSCHMMTPYGTFLTEDMICASQPRAKLCLGDDGGPLITERNGSYFLRGITSWGFQCSRKRYPAVYTRVSHFVDFIYRKSKEIAYCWNPAFS